ncbi:uncharacterized protein PITG_21726 [Phytophthora infestans T30-4]|uniref:Uncharacterized protein n=1 Tax=Phytophthora infestans (strain T30-4) TaxID=403677 RepID=D0P4A7_PHYIT|nr:uncharacterized protein PITG_21726 [Phytophthora infestans T30-4]EEY64553.1 hypothetical protein PITG_21726 [Phytophthora infestans T30-4]|eukprot:XP_002894868.1 hypothetical protein PITG_21726 [Phytophthora infestans T30-4]
MAICEENAKDLAGGYALRGHCVIYTPIVKSTFVDRLDTTLDANRLDSVQLKRHRESSSRRGAAKWDHEHAAG